MLPQLLAGVDVEGEHVCAVVNQIESIAVDDRRRVAAADSVDRPLDVSLGERALPGRIDRGDQTHLVCVEVLLAV